ncbi:EutN/CcmL family microcompartment protein [Stieleria sp. ICT_E10.1]|uniref:EutN/CcmL family microcompartment protein n=1 Tax=Stieleria sedimenti TaxID=2976331 RepID=UPI0021808367|nr:EutN/CcmL family microcompartment protein [Stieleria sedimenti]MCS7467927.1 EutN/CcmL family microcompartment protein [Stieleria sedimenti]
MQPAIVLGSTHATVKHESLVGMRLVVLQPIGTDEKADGPPLIALDQLGSRKGDHVMITSDGSYAREACGHDQTPARWTVIGLIDDIEA